MSAPRMTDEERERLGILPFVAFSVEERFAYDREMDRARASEARLLEAVRNLARACGWLNSFEAPKDVGDAFVAALEAARAAIAKAEEREAEGVKVVP